MGENYKEYAKELRAHLDLVGIPCNQAHAPFSLKYGMDNTYEEKYLNIVRSIEAASILGAKNIIVHAISVPEDVDFEQYNIEYYKSFIPYCEAFNIHVAIENLYKKDTKRNRIDGGKFSSPKELNNIIKAINSPWIVACVDIGHASLTGFEPEDFISKVDLSALKCLHVQDNDYLGDRHMPPYFGGLNWDAIMTALKKSGYEEDLTLEIPGYLKKFPKELLPDALKFAAAIGKHLISIYENA